MLDTPAPRSEAERLIELLEEQARRARQRKFFHLYPDETQRNPDGTIAEIWDGTQLWARDLYPRHLEFFEASATYREVGLVAANRTGKSFCGAFSDTCHLTGLYPKWWPGRRFPKPIKAWACGKTYETTKTIMQATLLGDVLGSHASKRLSGTGMIPGHLIDPASVTWRQGVNDLVDTVRVKHVTGGWSTLSFKSAQQGRGAFEGTAQHLVHLDEEFPLDIYMECLTRTATTNGLILATWTPLDGQTETVELFYPKEV